MKVKVNIRDYLAEQCGHEIRMDVPVRVDIDDLLDDNSIPDEDEFDIDIHEVLAEHRQIAHIWGIDDVQTLRPDLNDDQAWQVLQTVERRLDSNYGITWDTLELVAEELHGRKPSQCWHGRIDVSVEGYDRDEASAHFTDLAAHIEKDAVNTATRATFDPASLRCADPTKTDEAKEEAQP